VHEDKDCSADMGEIAEAAPVELTQYDICNLKPFHPEELAEMGKCVETTSVAANLFNPKPQAPSPRGVYNRCRYPIIGCRYFKRCIISCI
jgi:hypothetical protein